MEERNKMDDLFNERFEEGESQPSAAAWGAIQQRLTSGTTPPVSKTRLLPFVWLSVAFLSGVLLSGVGFYTYQLRQENEALRTEINRQKQQKTLYEQVLLGTSADRAQYLPSTESDFALTGTQAQRFNSHYVITNPAKKRGTKERTHERTAAPRHLTEITLGDPQVNGGMVPGSPRNTLRTSNATSQPMALTAQENEAKTASKNSGLPVGANGTQGIALRTNSLAANSFAATSVSANEKQRALDVPHPASEAQRKAITTQLTNNAAGNTTVLSDKRPVALRQDTSYANNGADLPTDNKTLLAVTVSPNDSVAIAKQDTSQKVAAPLPIEKKRNEKKGWKALTAIGFYLAPEMAGHSVHFSQAAPTEAVNYKKNDERIFSIGAGVNLEFQLPNHFFLRTGLSYWNVGERNTSVYSDVKKDTSWKSVHYQPSTTTKDSIPNFQPSTTLPDKAVGGIALDVPEFKESLINLSSTIRNNYHYIGLPVVVGMKLGRSRLSTGLYSGIIANVLVSSNQAVYYVYYDAKHPENFTRSHRELSRVTFAYWGGVDIDWRLSSQWSVSISPNIKYALTSIYKNEPAVRQLPYSVGLQFGCKYTFGKTSK